MESIIELRHLKTLLALAETGSVSLAAKRVFLTQSALSHQIRALENHFGTPLFERKTTPLRFTPAGERLLQLAREVMPHLAAAERDLAQIAGGGAGELRLAVECHTCFDWLMPAMGDFRPLWPKVELDIVSGFQADPVSLLLTHRWGSCCNTAPIWPSCPKPCRRRASATSRCLPTKWWASAPKIIPWRPNPCGRRRISPPKP